MASAGKTTRLVTEWMRETRQGDRHVFRVPLHCAQQPEELASRVAHALSPSRGTLPRPRIS